MREIAARRHVGRAGLVWLLLSLARLAEAAPPPEPTPTPAPAIPTPAPASPTPAVLERAQVAAAGEQAVTLTVSRFGRYALTVASAQGTALQLVDRMAGPREQDGASGERDGRLDVFLDRGQYRLVTSGTAGARGTARLAARAFAELHAPRPPMLVELKPIESTLEDLQQRSWWLQLESARDVALEAAGRNLSDLRLWKDGTWLVAAAPDCRAIQPRLGRPLLDCRLSARLDAGLYLLSAYGGPGQPWSEDDGTHPLHLRYGIERLAEAGRQRRVVSPFGIDRFLVPGATNLYRVELPEARGLRLGLGVFDARQPFAGEAQSAEVAKTSVPPVAEIRASPTTQDHFVTVAGEAGQPYVLQQFQYLPYYTFQRTGQYWLASVHTGHAADSVDATAVVTSSASGGTRQEPYLADVIALDAASEFSRRVNLLETLTLFVEIRQAGAYVPVAEGVEARFRIEPFLTSRPANYETPASRPGGVAWDLQPGYWVLSAEPVKKGIATLRLGTRGLLDTLKAQVGLERAPAAAALRAAVRFVPARLEAERSYGFYLNRQPDVKAGLVLRELPVDLGAGALPVVQRPGEIVDVPFQVAEPGTLGAQLEDGEALELSVDGGTWQKAPEVAAGRHGVKVRHTLQETATYSLAFLPRRLRADAPPEELPDTALAALPRFPELSASAPQFLDLERASLQTFQVRVDQAGLYALESTGLLATQGTLRSRTVLELARQAQNGVGRNFRVGQYLREGEYQLSVAAQGQSQGHLGLQLGRTRVAEGGFLTSGLPARATLRAGEAALYRFVITKPGEFRLRSFGLSGARRWRLEDKDGWPLLQPGGVADLTRTFGPGRYRLVVLPEPNDARVITLIEPVVQPRRRDGHGPHALPLSARTLHVWVEPEGEAPRAPDVWRFELPADVDVSVQLDEEMQAELVRVDPQGARERAAFVPPLRGWSGRLPAGRYQLEAVCARRNNFVGYYVGVFPTPLLPGASRDVSAPAEVPLVVGRAGVVEISSFGAQDVKARLYDSARRLVAQADDRPDDWNFALGPDLAAGAYTLVVEPVGAASASTRVSVRRPREVQKPAVVLPARLDLALGREAQLLPLQAPAGGELLVATLRSPESVGLAVEVQQQGAWRSLASDSGHAARVALLLPAGLSLDRLRLKAWSLDRRGSPAQLQAALVRPAEADEPALAAGLRLTEVAGLEPLVAAAVRLARPGLFRVTGEAGASFCAEPSRPCAPAANAVVSASGPRLLVLAESAHEVRAARVRLQEGGLPVSLRPDETARCDLAPAAGPQLVRASSEAGQPGVSVIPTGESPARSGGRMAVGTRVALAAALGGRDLQALVWPASPLLGPTFEARLERRAFPEAQRAAVAWGAQDGQLAAGQALRLDLPAGSKRVGLDLEAGAVAVLSQGETVLSVHGTGGEALSESVETGADRLTVLALEATRYALELLPLAAPSPARLAPGQPFERTLLRAGRLRLELGAVPAGARLRVRGSSEAPWLVDEQGRVQRGAELRLDRALTSGTLLVPHGPGLVLAWLESPGDAGLWPPGEASVRDVGALPALLELRGAEAAFRVRTPQPALLRVRAAAPVITRLTRGAGPAEVDVHPDGARLDVYLPAEGAELRLRPLGGGALSATLELQASPITTIGEGLGPELLLAAGATRLFAFTLTRQAQVGVGVRASADVVTAALWDAQGQPLGEGLLQMPTLEPGTYLLALHAPADGSAVRVQPALAGLAPPDTGPPADVVQAYLAPPEEGQTSFSAREGVAPPSNQTEEAPESEAALEEDGEAVSEEESVPDEEEELTPEDAESEPESPADTAGQRGRGVR